MHYLVLEDGLSDHLYATDITQFLAFLDNSNVHEIGQLEPKYIRAYLAELDQRGLAGSSRRRKFSVIESFCKWLKDAGHIANNPALQVETPQTGDKEPSMNFRVLIDSKGYKFRDSLDHSLAVEMRNLSGGPIPNFATL